MGSIMMAMDMWMMCMDGIFSVIIIKFMWEKRMTMGPMQQEPLLRRGNIWALQGLRIIGM